MTPDQLKNLIDLIFNVLEESLRGKPFMLFLVGTLHALAIELIPKILPKVNKI